jgi:hypothetical protein
MTRRSVEAYVAAARMRGNARGAICVDIAM